MPWEWKSMVVKIRIGEAISFGENQFFCCGARKHPQMSTHSIPHSRSFFPHAFGASWGVTLTIFCNCFIFHGWEIQFCCCSINR